MKKYFLIIVLLCCTIGSYAQSISLFDLTNMTSLTSTQIDDYFIAGKLFKLQYGDELNGFVVKHYQTQATPKKIETVITGTGYKTASGSILYTVSYVAAEPQNIINLISQTKDVRLKLTFQGADEASNIYIYDNFLYHVVFKIAFSQNTGSVDITQKQVFAQ